MAICLLVLLFVIRIMQMLLIGDRSESLPGYKQDQRFRFCPLLLIKLLLFFCFKIIYMNILKLTCEYVCYSSMKVKIFCQYSLISGGAT